MSKDLQSPLSAGEPLSISRLILLLQEVVEENFVQVLVEGEISNFAIPTSGHAYLTLKDAQAQLRAVIFRSQVRLLKYQPADGMQVICRGRVSLYRPRGELQLIIDTMEPRGLGELQLAFEQLKGRLAAEGLFADELKKRLPAFPRRIGIVTSPTGAAIRDMLNVLERRAEGIHILLRPVRVQGEGSGQEVAAAIADLNCRDDVDVIIIGRGGGSLEDLWAFNEEVVARAIHQSVIPVISAIGHETDWTIADFVADLRAPTPSAAAELVVKNRHELENHIDHLSLRLRRQFQNRICLWREKVEGLRRRLVPPRQKLELQQQELNNLRRRLVSAWGSRLQVRQSRLAVAAGKLDSLSPLQTLSRGYSIVFKWPEGTVLRSATEVSGGDRLRLRLARGDLLVRVEDDS